jgi:hypothetical protein
MRCFPRRCLNFCATGIASPGRKDGCFRGNVRSFVYEGSVKVDIAFLGQLADPGKRAPN